MVDFLVTSAATETNGTAGTAATTMAGNYNDTTQGTSVGGTQQGTLREAINYANANPGQTVTITFATGVTSVILGKELPVLTGNAVIDGTQASGTNVSISGNNQFRPFIVGDAGTTTPSGGGQYSLTLQNVTVTSGTAQGGAGADEGGGGAGLGGAVLVTSNGALTLDGATLASNSATGGNSLQGRGISGGGGGLAGAGGANSDGYGSGSGGGGLATGSVGTYSGGAGGGTGGGAGISLASGSAIASNGLFNGGGGGALLYQRSGTARAGDGGFGGGGGGADGAGGNGSSAIGGRGGFGGGGGAADAPAGTAIGGNGGFGGGGGGAGPYGGNITLGTGGFAAGSAVFVQGGQFNSVYQGGGGAGLGGAVFVQAGGTLSITGDTTESGSTVTAGNASQTYGGKAFGSAFFVQGTYGATQTVNYGAGNQSIANDIADYLGSGGTNPAGNGAAAGANTADQGGALALAKTGTGTLTLSGNNSYTGGTTISAGTLELNAANAAGRVSGTSTTPGAVTFSGTAARLQLDTNAFPTGSTTYTGGVMAFSAGDTIDLRNLAYSGSATATYNGSSLIVASGANSDTLSNFTAASDSTSASFAFASDNMGGTLVSIAAPMVTTPPPSGGGNPPATSTPVNPTISGTHATQDTAEGTVMPFSGVTVADANASPMDSLAITLTSGSGMLSGIGLTGSGNTYALAATDPTTLTSELDALTFTPTNGTPGAVATTTFQLIATSNAGTAATDNGTSVTDTAAAAPVTTGGGTATPTPSPAPTPSPVPTPSPAPTPVPVAPGSGGAVVPPADTISIDPTVSYADGVFTGTGRVSSALGVPSVDITAQVNGVVTDLGTATVNANGTFVFSDIVGANLQSFITATETNSKGGTASAQAAYSLQGGLGAEGNAAEQDTYSADGSTILSTTKFQSNGASIVDVGAPNQTVDLQPFGIVDNHHQANTSFVFNPGDGLDVIHGFKVGGANHDTLELPSSDFKNLADVLAHTGDIGGSAFITDPVTGDAIRLANVTTAELKQHPKDFAFHG